MNKNKILHGGRTLFTIGIGIAPRTCVVRRMSQKSITSFFQPKAVTPKRAVSPDSTTGDKRLKVSVVSANSPGVDAIRAKIEAQALKVK